jgi:hypothetical protein
MAQKKNNWLIILSSRVRIQLTAGTRREKDLFNRTAVVQNKSSLLQKIIFKNIETLQLLTINIKTELIFLRYSNGKQQSFRFSNLESYN